MATEKLLPDADDGGWPTGTVLDVDEGIASADGNIMAPSITVGDAVRFDLGASAVVDGDTVTEVKITIRGLTTGSGLDKFRVALVIDGTPRQNVNTPNLTASMANYELTDADWDQDWTAAQMDGAQVNVIAHQTGMPSDAGHELDCFDVDVTFTLASGGLSIPIAMYHHIHHNLGTR